MRSSPNGSSVSPDGTGTSLPSKTNVSNVDDSLSLFLLGTFDEESGEDEESDEKSDDDDDDPEDDEESLDDPEDDEESGNDEKSSSDVDDDEETPLSLLASQLELLESSPFSELKSSTDSVVVVVG